MSGILTFQPSELHAVLQCAIKHWPNGVKPLFHQPDDFAQRGFWVVGDEGVYIMHNGKGGPSPATLAYATECNPKANPDGWYDVKHRIFGGDDGVDFIDAKSVIEAVCSNVPLKIRFTPDSMEIYYEEKLRTAPAKKGKKS